MTPTIIGIIGDAMRIALYTYIVYCIHSYLLRRLELYGPMFKMRDETNHRSEVND